MTHQHQQLEKNYQCVTKFGSFSEFVIHTMHLQWPGRVIASSYEKVYWEIGVKQAEQLNSVLGKSVSWFQ